MHHIIRKQVLELKLADGQDMFGLQQKVSLYYYKHILPSLEKIFDSLSDEKSFIQIDRLEIDLGVIHWDKEVQEIRIEYLFALLQKQSGELIRKISGQYFLLNKDGREISVKKIPGPQSAGEQWIYYMERGIIPWNAFEINDGWRTQVLEALATDYQLVTELKELIRKNKPAIERIIREHTMSFLVTLAEILTAHKQRLLPAVAKEMERIMFPDQPAGGINLLDNPVKKESEWVWRYLLKKLGTDTGKTTAIQIARIWIEEEMNARKLPPEKLFALEKELVLLGPVIEEVLSNEYPQRWKEKKDQDQYPMEEGSKSMVEGPAVEETKKVIGSEIPQEKASGPDAPAGIDERANEPNTAQEVIEEQARSADNAEILDEGIYIKYAGLVLLHPFFKFLFKQRGLIGLGKFIDKAAQEKAIYLLHYLATGTVQAEEYLLASAKLLCSWPLEDPLQSEVRLTAADIMEADDLIHAAIAQWTILKNTSADGLREGFLQRSGKVFMKNGDICYIMETHAIDLLLDHLPWNLSVIKLPWLKELIRVEWR